MKTKEEISNLSDEELVVYTKEIRELCLKEITEVQEKHGVKKGGVLNYRGEGKEYLNIDLSSYYKNFVRVINKYVIPIENEIKIRIRGNDEYYSELHEKTYKFNINRLEYFEENIPNSFIGRLTPRFCNPNWMVHLGKIKRLYKQEDYKEVLKQRQIEERENKLNNILGER
jgi:hypothetical protein